MNASLRPVTEADLQDLLRWRNHPRVRRAMVTKHRISAEEHAAWWQKTRADKTKQWRIYEENGEPLAVASFFRLDAGEKTGWWGFYLCDYSEQNAAGRAPLARRVIQSVICHAAEELKLCRLLCEVFKDNLPARRLYEEHGFRESRVAPSAPNIGLVVMELQLAP
ncbi:MAG: UDP-4-amino-4,6-dideoxy-N-acetyl-beta-L-altrosamine N-acetyltransferase [Gammaproteobacteria bacterium]|nr:UDP-4-amino-4,6-dideoxy-N-acetyl-beta-L-altrosamine N-acetyltransferase [Gammaproteobacteria bacterium]MDD9886445.1 UDP-4-amino-4,6-dideoxy-N-acetyl-beta-L-altrosamine N-acetyltransferase [Gammaproteobacteria bacterium]